MAKIKTKARALDMLGRQQIAGIPTALSELFKNAHDAYADNVEVDYIRKKNLLIIRDDGLGMTLEEFEQRWLTIGTSSKLVDDNAIDKPVVDSNKKLRPVMGEKGIGRLSIAAIGPQVLVLTRAKREDGLKKLVAAFINWSLFSIPSLDLDDIEIPVIELSEGRYLSEDELKSMLDNSIKNIVNLKDKISTEKSEQIIEMIKSFKFDPVYWDKILGGLSVSGNGHGTQFIISPVEEIIADDIDKSDSNRQTDQSSRLEKALLGFTNTMYSTGKPPIIARFRDHTLEGECIDRIGESVFFTPNEFVMADHNIEGEFNEYGQFNGKIAIYGQDPVEHTIPWLNGLNKITNCGPFKLKIAYVHGTQRESRLPPELWNNLSLKTNRYGGLYIYRDGIRVLPYGDSDVDFLRIEQRRSKHASSYFFSYRRMFGAIEISKSRNSLLEEKAGREGFIENKAYKQLKDILENFFIQMARDFFNENGELSDIFIKTRERNRLEYETLRKRSQLTATKKKKLKLSLDKFFDQLDSDHWNLECEKIKFWSNTTFSNFEESGKDIDDLVFDIENHTRVHIGKLESELIITKPSGIGLNKELSDLWDRYQYEKSILQEIVNKLKDSISTKLIEFEDKYGDRTGLRRRFYESLKLQQDSYNKKINSIYIEANEELKKVQEWTELKISESRKKIKQNANHIQTTFNSSSFYDKSTKDLFEFKKSLEEKIDSTSLEIVDSIESLTEQIRTIKEGTYENIVSSNKLTETLETELEHLREQHSNNIEMVKIGMALGVVHHEFNGNIRSIRNALRDLKPWAEQNIKLYNIFERLRTGFDHLDGYLKTFTPLTRRLSRKKVIITGSAIIDFVKDVFHDKLVNNEITIECTNQFINQSIFSYTSSIYPAFINIIDNSIYWLTKSSSDRKIIMDAKGDGFIISDSGPGISTRDREAIFELGFTRKMGGRGMGLYISRETLAQDNLSLKLEPYSPKTGASFSIEPLDENEIELMDNNK